MRQRQSVSRRRLLTDGAAGTAAALLLLHRGLSARGNDADDEGEAIVAGSLIKGGIAGGVLVDSVDHGHVHVQFIAGAELWKDGKAELSDFVLGDEVATYGAWQSDNFLATRMEPLYRELEGSVLEVDIPDIVTSSGVVTTIPETQAVDAGDLVAVDAEDLMPADVIAVLGRRDPSSSDLIALRFGLVP